jgi:CheY-like chemotaxis protein
VGHNFLVVKHDFLVGSYMAKKISAFQSKVEDEVKEKYGSLEELALFIMFEKPYLLKSKGLESASAEKRAHELGLSVHSVNYLFATSVEFRDYLDTMIASEVYDIDSKKESLEVIREFATGKKKAKPSDVILADAHLRNLQGQNVDRQTKSESSTHVTLIFSGTPKEVGDESKIIEVAGAYTPLAGGISKLPEHKKLNAMPRTILSQATEEERNGEAFGVYSEDFEDS